MRRGSADLHRRGEVSQKVNERYLEALASVDDSTRLQEILEPIEKDQEVSYPCASVDQIWFF